MQLSLWGEFIYVIKIVHLNLKISINYLYKIYQNLVQDIFSFCFSSFLIYCCKSVDTLSGCGFASFAITIQTTIQGKQGGLELDIKLSEN